MTTYTTPEVTEIELIITRVFNAPRNLVFNCWTEQKHLEKWQGAPEGFTVTVGEVNIHPGGRSRICMHSPDGADYWLETKYQEIIEPEKIVFTHAWLDGNGNPGKETVVTLIFREVEGKTELTLHQTGFSSIESRNGHGEGWTSTFNALAEYLAHK